MELISDWRDKMTAILIIILLTNVVGWFFTIGALCSIDTVIRAFVNSFTKHYKKENKDV